MGDKEWFQVCGPQVLSRAFHCNPIPNSEAPHCADWKHTSASGGVNKVPWPVVGLAPLIQEAHQCAKDTAGALNLIRVVAHQKWGGDRDTLLMLYRAIVHSKLDYGCIVYGSASNTDLRQLDSIHNSGFRLALEHSAPDQCPACTQRPTKLLWRNAG